MSICYFLHFGPLLDDLWAKFILAVGANVSDLSFVGIAFLAEIFKKYVDLEIFGQNFVFVFADILWTQLHLACTDVIAIL